MKSMRFIFALCVVAMATFFIYSCAKDGAEKQPESSVLDLQTVTRAAEPCENANLSCPGGNWSLDKFANFSLPDYPGCTFQVRYQEKSCLPDGFDLQIVDWVVLWPGCPDWDDAINNAPDVGLLHQKTEKQLMELLVNGKISSSTDIHPCGGIRTTMFGFSTGACIKFCAIQVGNPTKSGEIGLIRYAKLPCGEACCRTTFEVCRNPSGTLTINQNWSQGTGNCNAQTPSLPCPINTIFSTQSLPNCQGL